MPDSTKESEREDVVVHAQRVLEKVQLSKRNMELQSELEEAGKTFGDFVQSLGRDTDDE